MVIKSSYIINPEGIYSMLVRWKPMHSSISQSIKIPKIKVCVLRVIGSKLKWKHCVPLLTEGQNHCHNGGCSPYTNTSLPCTSSHWWVLCPWQAAGRRCDTLYHTCHTPAFCCLPLGSYQPDEKKIKIKKEIKEIPDTGLGAFAKFKLTRHSDLYNVDSLLAASGQLGKFQWQPGKKWKYF